jgi:hypothetical protein
MQFKPIIIYPVFTVEGIHRSYHKKTLV